MIINHDTMINPMVRGLVNDNIIPCGEHFLRIRSQPIPGINKLININKICFTRTPTSRAVYARIILCERSEEPEIWCGIRGYGSLRFTVVLRSLAACFCGRKRAENSIAGIIIFIFNYL